MEVYLDNAATSHPKPPEVLTAVQEALTALNGNPGRSGHQRALKGARLLLEARSALASFIQASSPEEIIFTFNCTDSLNTAIKGSLYVGDHVVASCLEHNSVLRVLETLRARNLITYTLIAPEPDGFIDPAHYIDALTPRTRLCILTHASNVTGAIQPVAALGRLLKERGILFLIDGAQAAGHLPVNVQALNCDLYAFPGHKGLLGPQGTGALYIRSGLALQSFREGGTGSSSDNIRQPSERPECYESGTVNLPGIAGLFAGVRLVSNHLSSKLHRELELTAALIEGLRTIPGITLYTPDDSAGRVSTVSFNIGSDLSSQEAADYLDTCGIAVRGGLHCAPGTHQWLGTLKRGAVRASLSWQNTFEDIEHLLCSLHALSKSRS